MFQKLSKTLTSNFLAYRLVWRPLAKLYEQIYKFKGCLALRNYWSPDDD